MSSSNATNEQPMSKRQKIDASDNNNKGAFNAIFNGTDNNKHRISDNSTPPDILPMTKHEHKCTTNANPNRNNSKSSILSSASSSSSSAEARTSSSETLASDELDNATACNIKSIEKNINFPIVNDGHCIAEFPDLLKTSPEVASTSRSHDEFGSTATHNCSNRNKSTYSCYETSSRLSSRDSNNFSRLNNIDEFQLYLMKQCLCDVDKHTLLQTFGYLDATDVENRPLEEWPAHQLIQFLSNVELLFEIYLKQNAKGEICEGVMKLCDLLILNSIDGIFELDEYNNKFVQYLAIKVLANCLLIVKDKVECCDKYLDILMSKLITNHAPTDHNALRKVSFILGIILHIMEWKDMKKHPLDDQIVINGREVYNDSDNESFSLPISMPRIEDNYFAVHHNDDGTEIALTPPTEPHFNDRDHNHQSNTSQGSNDSRTFSCHIVSLSDSESFDSNDLKLWILNKLRPKWSVLVTNIRTLLQSSNRLHYNENTVITFLTLWERIINVDSCLEYESTLSFHQNLKDLTRVLIEGKLSTQIYMQILTLFSASLCYTTTLALQPEIPQATTDLATQLFNSVKDNNSRNNIFSSLPTREIEPENNVSFIGYKHNTIVYEISADRLNDLSDNRHNDENDDDDDDDNEDSEIDLELNEHSNKSIDFTLLQKLVLLALKAIAVTVRPIGGGDSSDSSMDSCSSSSSVETVENDWTVIEIATKDAFEKMQSFLRNKLNFHPETHFSKVIIHLFSNQDDYLLEAMLCMLGTTIAFLPRQPPFGSVSSRQSSNLNNDRPQLRMLINIISPVYTFLEFLDLIQYGMQTLLDFLITDETCFLLYFLRFLKYIRSDWTMFQSQCNKWHSTLNTNRTNSHSEKQTYKRVMDVLIQLRLKLDRLVFQQLFPYNISPLLLLMRQCESLYEGNYGLC